MAYVILAIVVLIVIFIIAQYNSLIKLRNSVNEGFSTMDVYLKKRWDLIPNLVETVKGYAKHESEVLENVTKLRENSYENMSSSDKIEKNQQLSKGILNLMAVAEQYPELKANQNFINLNQELSRIEEDIANSRKYYNAVVRNLNNKIEMFPSNIISNIFGFKKEKMFETSTEEKNNVKVEF